MSARVHIVAIGARTPVGHHATASAAAVRAGISRVREHPVLLDAAGHKLKCAIDSQLDPWQFGAERILSLTRTALLEAVSEIRTRTRLCLLLSLPEARPGFGSEQARYIQTQLLAGALGEVSLDIELVGAGHAGSLQAVEMAVQRIAENRCSLCIVGGADSYFDARTLDWLESDQRLRRAEIRSGLLPGEGASVLVLASDAARRALELESLACVRHVTTTREHQRGDEHEGRIGKALTQVFLRAGASLPSGGLFDDVYCDINGERDRIDDYGFALMRTGRFFRDGTAYRISAGQCGDLGAASAAFHSVLAVQAWRRGGASGSTALVWAASWSGLRGALVLERSAA